jgi:dihydrofolate synthase/folylpolyglutamate synthase
MPLDDVLEKLYARRRFGIRPGVERVRLLLDSLGRPDRSFRTIHVVGTNGKGSTAAFLASILSASGLRTALFTSPHLISFTERYRINGTEIAPARLEEVLATVLKAAAGDETFFELVTGIAALYFAEEHVDVAIMEAGMGGRSDATATLIGCATVITPISLDHCDYLGTTIQEIAAEKAGIAKTGAPVIVGHQTPEAAHAIQSHFLTAPSQVVWTDQSVSASWNRDGTLDYRGLGTTLRQLTTGLPGKYQSHNAALALASAEILGSSLLTISEDALRNGVAQARWPGRMEYIPGSPPLLLDGAHNAAGAAALADALTEIRFGKLRIVLGVMADKDVREIVSSLAPLATAWYCVSPAIERSMGDHDLAELLCGMGYTALPCGSVANGIQTARKVAGEEDLVLVCGSLFTVGEAKSWLAGTPFEGIRG